MNRWVTVCQLYHSTTRRIFKTAILVQTEINITTIRHLEYCQVHSSLPVLPYGWLHISLSFLIGLTVRNRVGVLGSTSSITEDQVSNLQIGRYRQLPEVYVIMVLPEGCVHC